MYSGKTALNKDKRLILEKLQAPEWKNRRGKKFVLFSLIVLGIFGFACISVADAGFFDFVGKIFTNGSEEFVGPPVVLSLNSQNVSLLSAVLNPNPVAGYGGGGPTIINNSALLADVGPNGSMVEIEEEIANNDRISLYIVREGDSLSQIAEMFGVTTNTIIWANDIDRGDLIQVGQELVILPITGLRYIVKSGDTAKSLAVKFKSDAEEIILYNDLSADGSLAVGEEIIIPDGEIPYKPTPVYSGRTARGTSGPNYVGYYIRPISGGRKSQGLHGYNGVDLATYCGAPIFAAATGDVIISRSYGWNGGYGSYIVISHSNGTQTLYAHNSRNIVTRGWHVVQGQIIGYIGTTGKSTGCHVHFEVRGAKNPF